MPGKIFVEYYEISEQTERVRGSYHSLLVYEDEYGNEFIIRGGQKDESLSGTASNFFLDQISDAYGYGPILVDAGVPAAASRDYGNRIVHNTKENRRELTPEDLGGRDPFDIWQLMTSRAKEIGEQKIDYDLRGPNSNSTIASVLETVGIDFESIVPLGTTPDNFEGYRDRIPTPQELQNQDQNPNFFQQLFSF